MSMVYLYDSIRPLGYKPFEVNREEKYLRFFFNNELATCKVCSESKCVLITLSNIYKCEYNKGAIGDILQSINSKNYVSRITQNEDGFINIIHGYHFFNEESMKENMRYALLEIEKMADEFFRDVRLPTTTTIGYIYK